MYLLSCFGNGSVLDLLRFQWSHTYQPPRHYGGIWEGNLIPVYYQRLGQEKYLQLQLGSLTSLQLNSDTQSKKSKARVKILCLNSRAFRWVLVYLLGKEKAGLHGCCQSSGKNIMEGKCPHDRKAPYGSNSKYRIWSGGNKDTWHPSECLTAVFLGIEEGAHPTWAKRNPYRQNITTAIYVNSPGDNVSSNFLLCRYGSSRKHMKRFKAYHLASCRF